MAVAETLHFGRAAARLNIAQPPLSVQIRDLEAELGTPLFRRHARGVALTDAGIAFMPRAAAILSAAREAATAARDAAAGRDGRLVIGFVPTLAYSLLPAVLPSWRQANPNVSIALREVAVTDKEAALLDGVIDVGIYRPAARHPEIAMRPLGEEAMILALPANHPLTRHRRVPIARLAGQPMISFPPSRGDAGLYGTIAPWLRAQGIEPEPTEIAGTILTALGLVMSGIGLAIVPESAARLNLPGIAWRPFVEAPARALLAVCWRYGDTRALVDGFVEHIRQVEHPWSGRPRSPADLAGTRASRRRTRPT